MPRFGGSAWTSPSVIYIRKLKRTDTARGSSCNVRKRSSQSVDWLDCCMYNTFFPADPLFQLRHRITQEPRPLQVCSLVFNPADSESELHHPLTQSASTLVKGNDRREAASQHITCSESCTHVVGTKDQQMQPWFRCWSTSATLAHSCHGSRQLRSRERSPFCDCTPDKTIMVFLFS